MPDLSHTDLKNILAQERKAKLSALDNDFYQNVHKFLEGLEAERDKNEPDSLKRRMLQTELDAAKVNYELILELRMSKIIREASTQKSQKFTERHDPEHMTSDEKGFYDALYTLMFGFRSQRLTPDSTKTKEPIPVQAAAPVTAITPAAPKNLAEDYIVVRILANVPTFVGMDQKNYTLSREDIATVPSVNAMALISRKAAVKIGMGAGHASGT